MAAKETPKNFDILARRDVETRMGVIKKSVIWKGEPINIYSRGDVQDPDLIRIVNRVGDSEKAMRDSGVIADLKSRGTNPIEFVAFHVQKILLEGRFGSEPQDHALSSLIRQRAMSQFVREARPDLYEPKTKPASARRPGVQYKPLEF